LNTSKVVDEHGNIVALIGISEDITERKAAELHLQQSHERARALSSRLQTLREEERTRIAREIHDHLGQLLTALKLDLYSLERKSAAIAQVELKETLKSKIETVRDLADEVIESVQRIASELRPGILDRLGLVAAVEVEAQAFQGRSGIECNWTLPKDTVSLSDEQAIGVFRIFQEILTNIARHARASAITIALTAEGGELTLVVHDNGIGINQSDIENAKSLGILGMQERAAMLGGKLSFTQAPVKGTTVTVKVPLKKPENVL
jgi:signal transduction histidine kinase